MHLWFIKIVYVPVNELEIQNKTLSQKVRENHTRPRIPDHVFMGFEADFGDPAQIRVIKQIRFAAFDINY